MTPLEWAATVPIEILTPEACAHFEPHNGGQMYAEEVDGGGFKVWIQRRPDINEERAARFDDWARQAIAQLIETGDPNANGWFPSEVLDRGWFMIAAERWLPEID